MLLSADRVLGALIVAWGTRKTAAWEGPIATIQYVGQVNTARDEIILYKILFSIVLSEAMHLIIAIQYSLSWNFAGAHTLLWSILLSSFDPVGYLCFYPSLNKHKSSDPSTFMVKTICQLFKHHFCKLLILNYQSTCQFIYNYLAIKF